MSLSTTLQQIKNSLPREARVFTDARPRHSALAACDSPRAVVAALDRASALSAEDRDAVLLAILAELQIDGGALWQSLLLAALAPMLLGLRRRCGHAGDEDLDRNMLLAFLEAAREVRVRSHAARVLRLTTAKRLFVLGRVERLAPEALPFDEEAHDSESLDVDAREIAAAAEVARIVEATGGDELRDALLATYGGDESLRDYVDRTYAGSSAAKRASAYERLGHARRRAVAELRRRRDGCGRACLISRATTKNASPFFNPTSFN